MPTTARPSPFSAPSPANLGSGALARNGSHLDVSGNGGPCGAGDVALESGSTTLTTGSVTGNRSTVAGGLLVGDGCQASLAGSPVVSGNHDEAGAALNVVLRDGALPMDTSAGLRDGDMGVTLLGADGDPTDGTFTVGNAGAPVPMFSSDDDRWEVMVDADGEGMLGEPGGALLKAFVLPGTGGAVGALMATGSVLCALGALGLRKRRKG